MARIMACFAARANAARPLVPIQRKGCIRRRAA